MLFMMLKPLVFYAGKEGRNDALSLFFTTSVSEVVVDWKFSSKALICFQHRDKRCSLILFYVLIVHHTALKQMSSFCLS